MLRRIFKPVARFMEPVSSRPISLGTILAIIALLLTALQIDTVRTRFCQKLPLDVLCDDIIADNNGNAGQADAGEAPANNKQPQAGNGVPAAGGNATQPGEILGTPTTPPNARVTDGFREFQMPKIFAAQRWVFAGTYVLSEESWYRPRLTFAERITPAQLVGQYVTLRPEYQSLPIRNALLGNFVGEYFLPHQKALVLETNHWEEDGRRYVWVRVAVTV